MRLVTEAPGLATVPALRRLSSPVCWLVQTVAEGVLYGSLFAAVPKINAER